MNRTVIWSPASEEEYAEILIYIEDHFGLDAALKFLDKTDSVIKKLSLLPSMFPASLKRKDIRKAVITKHISLFYRFNNLEVQLLHFWDNRQNPLKIKEIFPS